MVLVHFFRFLNLDMVMQRAFAGYLRKKNFVESALSCHGPLSSKTIRKTELPGSEKHNENTDCMSEVIKCTGKAVYNREKIQCFRGIGSG